MKNIRELFGKKWAFCFRKILSFSVIKDNLFCLVVRKDGLGRLELNTDKRYPPKTLPGIVSEISIELGDTHYLQILLLSVL